MRSPTDEEILAKCPDEIDADTVRLNARNGRPRTGMAAKNKWWSEDDRIRAASVYAITGNAQRTSEITKIPAGTIRQWKTQQWWPQVLDRVRTEHDDELDAKISKVIEKTLNQVEDRVDNGDWVYDSRAPEGQQLKRVPMKGKEIAVTTSIMFDKRDLIRRKEKSVVEGQSTQQLLKGLLDEFRKFTGQKTVEGVVLDKEITEDTELSDGEATT
jgi:hypothetical protein